MTKPEPAALFTTQDWSPRAFISWRGLLLGLAGVFSLMLAYRSYQQVFGWSAGLDATDPAFDTYWMNLLKGELVVLTASWAGLWSYLWFTRDRALSQLAPREEIRRYLNLIFFIFVYAFAVYWTGSFFAEQDAAWHQTVVRDTPFTPSHIVLFYGTMPLFVLFGVGLVALRHDPSAKVRRASLAAPDHRRGWPVSHSA